MAIEMIGYVELYRAPDGNHWNFHPTLKREGAEAWEPCPPEKWLYLRPSRNLPQATVNNEVLRITVGENQLIDSENKWVLRNGRPNIHNISEEFLPVLHLEGEPDGNGRLRVREHIINQARDRIINADEGTRALLGRPEKKYPNNKPIQKGPAYVSGDALIQLPQDEENFYRVPLEAIVEGENRTYWVTDPRQQDGGAEAIRLEEEPRLWNVFQDIDENGRHYEFPRYVFFHDLEQEREQEPEQEQRPEPTQEPEPALKARKELCDRLCGAVQEYRPNYTRNEILSIAIAMTQNLLTVFSGEPGTGKTSICNIFGQVLGLRKPRKEPGSWRYVSVSVERGWTSKRDFIGYYNPIKQDIVVANSKLYDALDHAEAEKDGPAAPLLVLLDEANLSPMEYYWSDFMNIAGSDEGEVEPIIELGGSRSGASGKKRHEDEAAGGRDPTKIEISPACRFFATINNDSTTERLSPRIIDRAAVVSLPGGKFEKGKPLSLTDLFPMVSWKSLQDAFGADDQEPFPLGGEAAKIYQELKAELSGEITEIYKSIYENLAKERGKKPEDLKDVVNPLYVEVSYRVEKAIQRFWRAARQEGVFEGGDQDARDIAALDYAVAQRLLPKLEGSGETFRDALECLRMFCDKNKLTKCAGILQSIVRTGNKGSMALSYYAFFSGRQV